VPAEQFKEKSKERFAKKIGGFLLNFSAVEFVSFNWAYLLTGKIECRDMAINMRLADRIRRIKEWVKQSVWPVERQNEAIGAWDEVLEIAKLRNTVAHNPILEDVQQPGKFGILNAKSMQGSHGPFLLMPVLESDVASAGKASSRLALFLQSLIEEIIRKGWRPILPP
jgi:hypothetical protein